MFALQSGVDGADGEVFLPGLTVGIRELVWLYTRQEYVLCRAVGTDLMNCESRAAPEQSPYFVRASEKPAYVRRPPSDLSTEQENKKRFNYDYKVGNRVLVIQGLGHIASMAACHNAMSELVGCSIGHSIVDCFSLISLLVSALGHIFQPKAISLSDMNSTWR